MQHKHKEMILAKVNNMDLVKFYKNSGTGEWLVCSNQDVVFLGTCDYYLCLPQHKDVCLAWLNGASIQDYFEGEWSKCLDYDGSPWNWFVTVMNEECHLRVMPQKVTKWAVYHPVSNVIEEVYDNKRDAEESLYFANIRSNEYQLVSFEVEA